MFTRSLLRLLLPLAMPAFLPLAALAQKPAAAPANPSIVYKVQSPNERLEMTVHSSRILTLDQKIPQAQVNNPDLLDLTPLSPYQIQVSAKATGVTQINLWGEDQKLFCIDVLIYGDAKELEMILRSTFPNAALKVVPVSSSVLISGFVDKPEHIDRITTIAEQYYPKVINNMTVGGCQQVLLHVKVMEVSRTKLRRLGFDFAKFTGPNYVGSGVAGLLMSSLDTSQSLATAVQSGAPNTFAFGVVNGNNAFFGVLDALRQDNLLKIMADPTLVTVSGRAASFNSGGEFPTPVPQSLGTISIEWKKYGTQIDFVPIVLGNGNIRLEVRPRVSELDYANGVTINGSVVPGLKSRDADTGVEMMAGQTLAIAGLVQTRLESQNRGLPWISEVPYLGVPFRKVHETSNEVELLMLVTPELVEAMDANEVPQCGPGMQTTSPSDWELFMKGYLEVPNCCPANGQCQTNGSNPAEPPPDGMILTPGEKVPTPLPADAAGGPTHRGSNTSAMPSHSRPHSRQTRPNPNSSTADSASQARNSPPGFIGPVGYDVVK
jgi:pilus assembly protein CpaC